MQNLLSSLYSTTAVMSVREGDVLCAGVLSSEFYALKGALRVVSVERRGSYALVTAWAIDARELVEFSAEAAAELSVWAA